MKFHLVPCVLGILTACVMTTTTVRWSVAADIMPEHAFLKDRSLQDTPNQPETIDDITCDKVCDDVDQLSSIQVQVVPVEAENDGLFGSIIHRFNDFFDNGDSKFGNLMNGIFNRLQHRRSSNKPRYEINTDVIVPVLSKYSTKAKSLAALIRNESATYEAASATPDVVKIIFDLSAENMESVASIVIDPIVNDMRQLDTIDLDTVSCSLRQILTHLKDETFTNIVSITEFIYTKSGNDDMEEMYMDYIATRTSPTMNSVAQANFLLNRESNRCLDQGKTLSTTLGMESDISLPARIGNIGNYLLMVATPLALIVVLIILFPISFIVSFVTLIFSIFAIIILSMIEQFPIDDFFIVFAALGLIASPILIPIAVIALTLNFFEVLLSPLFGTSIQSPTNMSNDVMQKLSLVLDSSTEHMVDALKYMYRNNEETEDIEQTLDCTISTISCNNDALIAALPF